MKKRNPFRTLQRQSEKKDHLQDTGMARKIILKLALKKKDGMLIKIQPDATVCRYLFTAK